MEKFSSELKAKLLDATEKALREYDLKPIFFSLSGSFLYGTESDSDNDYDIRGCFYYPTEKILGLDSLPETIEFKEGLVDGQVHEVGKFVHLLIQPNANFVEETLSRLVIFEDGVFFKKLQEIARKSISKEMFPHIEGMTIHTYQHAEKEQWSKPKRILYLYRELLRGIVLFRDKVFESNIEKLAQQYGNPETVQHVKLLIELKKKGSKIEKTGQEYKDEVHRMQDEMLRLKTFGLLPAKSVDNKVFANRFLVNLRKQTLVIKKM